MRFHLTALWARLKRRPIACFIRTEGERCDRNRHSAIYSGTAKADLFQSGFAYQDIVLAIELNKTRGLSVKVGSEQYRLKDQSAQDIGRYDFIIRFKGWSRLLLLIKPALAMPFY